MERCFPAKSHSYFKWNDLCLKSEMAATSSWFAAQTILLSPLCICHLVSQAQEVMRSLASPQAAQVSQQSAFSVWF